MRRRRSFTTPSLALAAGVMLFGSAPLTANVSLGIYDGWGAFRDETGPRCYAIAKPAARASGSDWKAYVSVGYWPTRKVRAQLHFRLSKEKRSGAPIALSVGGRRFQLVSGGINAWAADPAMDAAIIAAMRTSNSLSISGPAKKGGVISDTYRLRGAASAIDAAALACARVR